MGAVLFFYWCTLTGLGGAHHWSTQLEDFHGKPAAVETPSWNVCIRAARRQLKVVGSGMGVLQGRKSFLDQLNQN